VSIVRVSGLIQRFGSNTVLNDINVEVEPGEILAVMGSSGGGKTTLLRCISGLIRATEGEIEVAGVSVLNDPEEARRHMGMVFQSAALFDFMTVGENVLFGVERIFHEMSRKERSDRVMEALGLVGLADDAFKMPDEISGGMRKRVGMARALVLKPDVMLYDEPTTGLDPITTYTIDELIRRFRTELGMASLLVSHDLNSVVRTSDRVAFLDAGEMVFLGDPSEFLKSKHPAIVEVVKKSQAVTLQPY
jgi:phospholipid/cholesterol/gamma-HCH transport system ATP-binding protein